MPTMVAPNGSPPPDTLGLPLTEQDHEGEVKLSVMQQTQNGRMLTTASSRPVREVPATSAADDIEDAATGMLTSSAGRDSTLPLVPNLEEPLAFGRTDSEGLSSQVPNRTTPQLAPSFPRQAPNNNLSSQGKIESSRSTSDRSEDDNKEALEDRVAELEAKLSTLTILLQVATATKRPLVSLGHSPAVTRSVSPTDNDASPARSPTVLSSTPTASLPLDSPCALGPRHRKRLSEVLLCDNSHPSTPRLQNSPSKDNELIACESSPQLPQLTRPQTIVQQQPPETPEPTSRRQFLDFLNSFQESNADVDMQMEEFVRVPSQVEQLLGFGSWICVDCFLYVITILPIRFAWSCVLGINTVMGVGDKNGPFRFHRRHLYQVIQLSIIFIVYNYVLCNISIGKLYHWIRGQVMLKLYLLIAITEVFDRLMCSLGQDCLESLYWNTTRRPHSARMLVSMSVVLVYAMVHTLLLFVHVATLNVAMNSSDQALLSLLIGGNFAEIKSTVFKKYNKQHLFKITASDICERFKLALFMTLVLILNLFQGMDRRMVYDFCYMCGVVWVAELLSDWVKHSFITKFNHIKSSVYPEFSLLLAGDVTGIGHEGVNLDHSHAVVKRLGLAQIPLVCVMFRYLTEATRYAAPLYEHVGNSTRALFIVAAWCVLLAVKFVSGSLLQKVASRKLEDAPHLVSSAKRTPKQLKRE